MPAAAAQATVVPADLIALGRLNGAYGLKGWFHVLPFADGEVLLTARQWWVRPASLRVSSASGTYPWVALAVLEVRRYGEGLVARCDAYPTPEAAQEAKGCVIAVARAAFPPAPEGSYYWVDLVGCKVVNREGQSLGVVGGLRHNGASDLLEVATPERADSILIPMVPQYVDAVDLALRTISVDWQFDWS